jgi:hypothetical protein
MKEIESKDKNKSKKIKKIIESESMILANQKLEVDNVKIKSIEKEVNKKAAEGDVSSLDKIVKNYGKAEKVSEKEKNSYFKKK